MLYLIPAQLARIIIRAFSLVQEKRKKKSRLHHPWQSGRHHHRTHRPRESVNRPTNLTQRSINMSRRRAQTGVQGPNSALTEYLRSRGIRARDILQFGRVGGSQNGAQPDQAPDDGANPTIPDIAPEEDETPEETENDEIVIAESSTTTQTINVEIPATASPRKRTRMSKKKAKKAASDDDFDASEDEEVDTSKYGRAAFTHKKRAPVMQPGKIDFCHICSQRFTITAYTKQSPDGQGLLCHKCGSVEQNAAKKDAPKRRRTKIGKGTAKMILEGKEDRIGKLQDACIKVIAEHIHDVDALGDIGAVNMDKICQIISRNRSLDNDTLPLFLQPDLTELRLYDCSRINTDKLEQIAYIMPNLKTLQLAFCGRLVDSTMAALVSRLHSLEHLILTGPFLITTQAWKSALETIGHKLRTFEISDTARWNEECSRTLVNQCPNLEVVGLKRINGISDECIHWLSNLQNLKSFALTEPTGIITDEYVVPIIRNAGDKLEKLVLDGCVELTDETFNAIIGYCPNLQYLSLALLDRISDECVAKGFKSWTKNHGLTSLILTRCVGIRDAGVQALLAHSGASLELLSLNSLDELTQDTFNLFTDEENKIGNDLVDLDVGFVRCVNDDVVYKLTRACKDLRTLRVFGNNYVTPCADARNGVRLIGREDFL